MYNVATYLEISGELHGEIWMPQTHCWKRIVKKIRIRPDGSLRDVLNDAMNDGNFRNPKLTPDTHLAIVREIQLPGGRVLSHHLDADIENKFILRRRRVLDTARLGGLYVSECDGHDWSEMRRSWE